MKIYINDLTTKMKHKKLKKKNILDKEQESNLEKYTYICITEHNNTIGCRYTGLFRSTLMNNGHMR